MKKIDVRIWRWPIVEGFFHSLLWAVFFLIKGGIPTVKVVGLWSESIPLFTLPVPMSRLFDIPVVAILFGCSIAYLLSDEAKKDLDDLTLWESLQGFCFIVVCLTSIATFFIGFLSALTGMVLTIVLVYTLVGICSAFGVAIRLIVDWANGKR